MFLWVEPASLSRFFKLFDKWTFYLFLPFIVSFSFLPRFRHNLIHHFPLPLLTACSIPAVSTDISYNWLFPKRPRSPFCRWLGSPVLVQPPHLFLWSRLTHSPDAQWAELWLQTTWVIILEKSCGKLRSHTYTDSQTVSTDVSALIWDLWCVRLITTNSRLK